MGWKDYRRALQQEPTPALQQGDFLLEYRSVGESGHEQVMARYFMKGGSRGEVAQLVPLTGAFDNQSLLDSVKFWLELLPQDGFQLDDTTRGLLLSDLLMVAAVIAASGKLPVPESNPPATLPPAVNVRG